MHNALRLRSLRVEKRARARGPSAYLSPQTFAYFALLQELERRPKVCSDVEDDVTCARKELLTQRLPEEKGTK